MHILMDNLITNNSAFRWVYLSFSPLPFAFLLYSAICKTSLDNHFAHLNAEFQRIARRDKKAFLSEQCKQIEENNRMGKTRDLFKKIRDTKGTFHAKMHTIKDRNSMNLIEAEDTKRWQEYTKELYKKDLNDPDNHNGWSDHLPRARHPGMWSQVGLRRHHYKQS